MDIINTRSNVVLRGEISTIEGNMFRLKIDEKDGPRLRYQVEGSLVGRPELKGSAVVVSTMLGHMRRRGLATAKFNRIYYYQGYPYSVNLLYTVVLPLL